MIQTGMTSEEMRDSILSPSVRANLLGKEKAILDSHGIYDSQAFVRCCQRLASKVGESFTPDLIAFLVRAQHFYC